eukprot:GGOE01062271.1.p1 GENE.GGOE01062271.1~~GGOE01062271.1.p1  ORF type:complete len:946 (-),score=282.70 GGOE01062271.1:89-2659(-)
MNTHISGKPPTPEEMQEALDSCREFLQRMKPVNTYVMLFAQMLKLDYDYEQSSLLTRLKRNEGHDRQRLESDGYSYFGMKLFGSQKGVGELFVKPDNAPIPYSNNISPGQTVWVSPDDVPAVDPSNNNTTCVGEVGAVNRESILIRGLTGLPYGKNGLYRIDLAVTTVNFERMQQALDIVRKQHERGWMQEKRFYEHIPRVDEEEDIPENDGLLQPGSPLARFFFCNIRYSLATARSHYRAKFGVSMPPGMPERWHGFNSYAMPPEPTDGPPVKLKELNAAAQQKHPRLRYLNTPLDCTDRPLSRTQHWLNENQLAAVAKVVDDGHQLTLIQGPPGTGKTTTAIAIICEWVMWYGWKILATAHSNKGVDNLLQGLVDKNIKVLRVGRGGPGEGSDLAQYSLEALVDKHPMNRKREEIQQQLKNAQRANAPQNVITDLMNEMRAHSKTAIAKVIAQEVEVICATCVGVGAPVMQGLQFDLVLVDEATQAVEPSVMIPITRGAKQVVMIGDQAQLPPTCKCPEAMLMGLDISLFDRLIGNGLECHVLDTQYRMHPTISCFPSWRFYHSVLLDGIGPADRILPAGLFPTPESRVCFIEVGGQEEQDNTSKLNRMEAHCVVWSVRQLMALGGIKFHQVGIITPYAAQVRMLRQCLQSAFGDAGTSMLEVHSVDGFQGREKDFIILSMVRSKAGGDMSFITDWRRTNVSLTRAKYGVIVVGQAEALIQSPIWVDWLKFYRKSLLQFDVACQRLVGVNPKLFRRILSRESKGEESTLEEMLARKFSGKDDQDAKAGKSRRVTDLSDTAVPPSPASAWAVATSTSPMPIAPPPKEAVKRDVEYLDVDASDDEDQPPAKKADTK